MSDGSDRSHIPNLTNKAAVVVVDGKTWGSKVLKSSIGMLYRTR